jgi:hypothetical protein
MILFTNTRACCTFVLKISVNVIGMEMMALLETVQIIYLICQIIEVKGVKI